MTAPVTLMLVFGTRPEAIKMAPLVKALQARPDLFKTLVCVTAQHRQMLDQVLALFDITPDVDLDLMKPNQDLFDITLAVLGQMKGVLQTHKPALVLVHGDTTTSMATSLACYYSQIPLAHVEAGLRTYNKSFPFPEEMNRVLTDTVADWFFAPTSLSRENLLRLGAPDERIVVTGNTVVDALFYTLERARAKNARPPLTVKEGRRLVLATVHRRENFGEPLKEIMAAFLDLLDRFEDIEIALPVHPNPNVKPVVHALLGHHPRIHLLEPLDYEPFCLLIAQAHLILTDSGGIQEEAPSLGIPVLVLRDETERPEAAEAGTVLLVGPHRDKIVAQASRLLADEAAYNAMAQASNPYGDGKACDRIVLALEKAFC